MFKMERVTFIGLILELLLFPSHELQTSRWRKLPMDNVEFVDFYLDVNVSSSMTCASICGRDDTCLSFSYDPVHRRCYLFRDRIYYGRHSVSSRKLEHYWRLYEICPLMYTYHDNLKTCVRFTGTKKSWSDVQAQCNSDKGHMLTAENPEKVQLDKLQYFGDESHWLGSKVDGQWRWLSGQEVAGQLLDSDWPNSGARCMAWESGGELEDQSCADELYGVCEIPLY